MILEIYTDGGCRGNGKDMNVGGWGVYLVYGENTTSIKGGCKNTTNNIMELTACIEALKRIKTKNKETIVYTDSAYVCNGITSWIYNWISKGWVNSKKEPVLNKELWIELYNLKKQFSNIQFVKVKGHSDNYGNNMADKLANEAMTEVEDNMWLDNHGFLDKNGNVK